MSLRRKLLIPILLLVVAGSVTGGVVMAQSRGDHQDRVLARAAEILGVAQGELGDALAQARSEIRDEEVDALIDRLTDEGVITADEAAQIREWLASRPDSLEEIDKNALASLFRLGGPGFGGPGFGGHGPDIRIPRSFGHGDLPGLHEGLMPNVDDLLRRFREFRQGQVPGDVEGFLDDFRTELEERFGRNGFGEGFFEFRFGGGDNETFRFQFPPNGGDEPVADPTSDQSA